MKHIKKEVVLDFYTCEECGREFRYDYEAVQCENNHEVSRCPHKNVEYAFYNIGDDPASINIHCEDCRRDVGEFILEREFTGWKSEDFKDLIEYIKNKK